MKFYDQRTAVKSKIQKDNEEEGGSQSYVDSKPVNMESKKELCFSSFGKSKEVCEQELVSAILDLDASKSGSLEKPEDDPNDKNIKGEVVTQNKEQNTKENQENEESASIEQEQINDIHLKSSLKIQEHSAYCFKKDFFQKDADSLKIQNNIDFVMDRKRESIKKQNLETELSIYDVDEQLKLKKMFFSDQISNRNRNQQEFIKKHKHLLEMFSKGSVFNSG
jgi:hypothetical protein